ncbi:class II glutamine amidotransferase [Microbacterium sp. 18062]|uniref:class II glutamine amidotransferase n=1 Tax=Microbacterium sp. 18062 TaxID=2681410 RepID=UPI001F3D7E3A|nr:class II glutamine amidotransferase [Microbacterium sp. 18062]
MLAYVSPHALPASTALGEPLLRSFLSLARLHRDGWGYAWATGPSAPPVLDTGLRDAPASLSRAAGAPATTALAYLRFASSGTGVSPENLQPFAGDGMAFAHNGALVPRERAEQRLRAPERRALRGTTDSEVYFALLRRGLRGPRTASIETSVAAGVARMRELYPEACLNAMLVARGELVVVHAPGTVGPPLAALAARGGAQLPPGHDAGYNALWTTLRPTGARVVATTGVDLSPRADGSTWRPLERDAVHVFAPDGDRRMAQVR